MHYKFIFHSVFTIYGSDEEMKIVCYVDSTNSDIIKIVEQIRRIDGIQSFKFRYKE